MTASSDDGGSRMLLCQQQREGAGLKSSEDHFRNLLSSHGFSTVVQMRCIVVV